MFRSTFHFVSNTIRRVLFNEISPKYSSICNNAVVTKPNLLSTVFRHYSLFECGNLNSLNNARFLQPPAAKHPADSPRTLTKFSLQKGKRKTVKVVLMRFYRLDWGMWIRTKCGRKKKLYKKTANHKRRLRQHVFTNATQSWLLDKMVTSYWKKPKYYVDDPYEPYHLRENFYITRKKPLVPVDS